MSDILEILRRGAGPSDIDKAADEIDRLRADLAACCRDRANAAKFFQDELARRGIVETKLREALEDADGIREAIKAAARELPYMSNDVEFFGVTDDEWTAMIRAAFQDVLDQTKEKDRG